MDGRLWLLLIVCVSVGCLYGFSRRRSYHRLLSEIGQEMSAYGSGSACDEMADEEPTQPLLAQEETVKPKWEQQFDEIMQIGWEVLHKKGA